MKDVLSSIMTEERLSARSLASKLGVNPGVLHRVLNGGSSPSVRKALKEQGYLAADYRRFGAWLPTKDAERAEVVRTKFDELAENHGLTRGELVAAVATGEIMIIRPELAIRALSNELAARPETSELSRIHAILDRINVPRAPEDRPEWHYTAATRVNLLARLAELRGEGWIDDGEEE